MAAKKPAIPLGQVVRTDHALSNHRRKLHRKARESALSDDGSIKLADAIDDEYLRLAAVDTKFRDTQSEKAGKPRGAIDGRTMADIVAKVARHYPDDDPRDVWPHLRSAIEDWAGECIERGADSVEYPFADTGTRTISFKHFCALLRDARREIKRRD